MPKNHDDTMSYSLAEADSISASIGTVKENTQVTAKDTGWTEEKKERMKKFGYDGLDMIRAWYS